MRTDYYWHDETFLEKIASWGQDDDYQPPRTTYKVHFEKDCGEYIEEDTETFEDYDKAMDFLEEMEEQGFECTMREHEAA